jgi:hypothetical protein
MDDAVNETTWRARAFAAVRRHGGLVLLASIWVLAIIVLLIWGQIAVVTVRSRAPNEEVNHTKDFRAPVTATEAVPAQMAPRSDLESLAIVPFNRRLVVQRRIIEYSATYPEAAAEETAADQDAAAADQGTTDEATSSPPMQRLESGDELETNVGQFIERSATRELDEGWISAVATVEQPNRVLLTVRFDRRNARLGDPGTYTGTISIVDPRVSRVDQQFTVQLAYPWWQFVAAQLVGMLVLAILYLWLLRGSFGSGELGLDGLERWLLSRNAVLSIGVGVGAAVSVWTATYFGNPAWDASFPAATALLGASFSAFVAASTAVTLAGTQRGGDSET